MASPTPVDLPDVNVAAPDPTQNTGSTAPYAKRIIQLTFTLAGSGSNSGGGAGGNTLTISGLRTFVTIVMASFPGGAVATIRVFGMTLSHINLLTKAGTSFITNAGNKISVAAGDVGGAISTIFTGIIKEAKPTFNNMPDCAFVVEAISIEDLVMTVTPPVTFPGQVTVEQALTQVLKPVGVTLKNNGVNVTLQSPYFPGGVWQQVSKIVQAANCAAAYDGTSKTFTISPKYGAATAENPAVISPATGMIGYPEFETAFIRVRTLFVPGVLVKAQSVIKVVSQLTAANGMWNAFEVTYNISAEAPGGPWEMIVSGSPVVAKDQPTALAGAAASY